jgi:hypothetical protein
MIGLVDHDTEVLTGFLDADREFLDGRQWIVLG